MRVASVAWLGLMAAACSTVPSPAARPRRPAPAMVGVNARPSSGDEGELAAPRWWLRDPRIFERQGRWDIDIILDVIDPRAVPHRRVPFRFDLRMLAFYDRDGRSPHIVHAVPVEGEPSFQFEQKVCFRAARTSTRRFRVPLALGRRDGFRPGEYELTVVRLDTGRVVGAPKAIVLH